MLEKITQRVAVPPAKMGGGGKKEKKKTKNQNRKSKKSGRGRGGEPAGNKD